ncbi:MAG: DNA mismatch repair protein MutT [SAR202 cluster bacterium Io17-Chloro-G4]|nr:MAG: DNA mismatch repair protein MutT [SAR202 cluster bacterium Io17-Chloro-G4]
MGSEEKYCPACATPLIIRDVFGTQRPSCPSCHHVVYNDPKVATTCIVERKGRVLMIRRALEPGIGLWCMPGGYVDRGEVVEEAAAREVLEETGLVVEVGSLVGLFSEKGRPVIVAAFAATETGGVLQAGPEAQEVDFFPLGDLPPLAFPRDVEILERWRHGLR